MGERVFCSILGVVFFLNRRGNCSRQTVLMAEVNSSSLLIFQSRWDVFPRVLLLIKQVLL